MDPVIDELEAFMMDDIDNTVWVVLGEPDEAEPFVAKVFAIEASANTFAAIQNAKQLAIVYTVHARWVEMDEVEYPSE